MLSKIEEFSLIAKCVATDDRNAFGRLVEEYQHDLRRFLFNLTLGDTALTDDLAQDTFLKAYLSIRQFKCLARFKTWLYRIAYNEFYSYMRKRQEAHDEKELNAHEEAIYCHNKTEAKIDVDACLKALNENERTVVLLFYLEDQPIKKISEITSLSEGTIKSSLSRARIKMAKLFNNN